jgi:hypothetical protein
MKIKNMLLVGSLVFALSCSTEDLTGVVDTELPEFQSCMIDTYNACAEAAGDDLTFKVACENNGVYNEKPCSTESVALKCDDVNANTLKGDVFLYSENYIPILITFGNGDSCEGVEVALKSFFTE